MIGGLVLAAGAGRRFGGPKQLAELDGRPLLEHALSAMVGVPALERVIVVLGAAADEILDRVELFGAEPVICADWQEGQAASLRAGVTMLDEAEAVLVTLGDQPRITSQVIAGVLDHRDPWRYDAVRATYAGRIGHPVLLERALLARVLELRGDVGARDLLAGARVRAWECGHLCDPIDIDTPDELEVLRR
jgi:molybdenum cofactor cytidylyltransferase